MDDEEFASPTIFPFLLKDGRDYLTADQVRDLHQTLTSDAYGPRCQIGQPVSIRLPGNKETAALRIAIGSRTLFEAWSPGPGAELRAIQTIAANIGTVFGKIALLLDRPASQRGATHGH